MTHIQNTELKTVYTRLVDSAAGYRDAAEKADAATFKTAFQERAQKRDRFASEIRTVLTTRGDNPEDEGSILASMHRTFTGVRDALSQGDSAVVNEIERGEKHLLDAYENVLEDGNASDPAYAELQRQRADIAQDLSATSAMAH